MTFIIMIRLYDKNGKYRNLSHFLKEHEILDSAGVGVELVEAPFAPGYYYYPIDLLSEVASKLITKYLDDPTFDIEEFAENLHKWHP